MAAPIVTSSIAFVWALEPSMTVTEVRSLILSTASDNIELYEEMKDTNTPALVVNLGKAVKTLLPAFENITT